MKTLKRTWADISLDNLEYNYRSIRAHLPSGTRFLGVMKADAYGHGAVPVSRALADLGAEYLAVSNLEEALSVREYCPYGGGRTDSARRGAPANPDTWLHACGVCGEYDLP